MAANGKVVYNLNNFLHPDAPEFIQEFARELKDIEVRPVDQLNCSFCGRKIEHIHAIHGTGELETIITREIQVNELGIPIEVEKVKKTSKRIVSCPDCVLNIPHDKLRSHQEG